MKCVWLAGALAITLAAGGCGQKGPLYLPDKNAKVVTTPAATQPAAPAAPESPPAPKPTDKDQDPQPPPK
jgi:predicted small lipoprotein YifL